jgi:hypothetical protein
VRRPSTASTTTRPCTPSPAPRCSAALAAKVAVGRRGLGLSHRLPMAFGGAVFVLLCVTWASAPEALE